MVSNHESGGATVGTGGSQKNDERTGKLLDLAFDRILKVLADSDRIANSPTTAFLVYAHNNKDALPLQAKAEKAQKLIEWMLSLRPKLISDRSPLLRDSLSVRDTGKSGAHNIVSNQLCLLPHTNPRNDTAISSVDKVILCSSEVLQSYMEVNEKMEKYMEDIMSFYSSNKNLRIGTDKDCSDFRNGIRKIVKKYSKPYQVSVSDNEGAGREGTGFHHVITEMAFLKIRAAQDDDSCNSIVPVILNGRPPKFLDNSHIWIHLKDTSERSIIHETQALHQMFFRVLKRVFEEQEGVISAFEKSYRRCTKFLLKATSGEIDEHDYMIMVKTEINHALDQVIGDGLTSFRTRVYGEIGRGDLDDAYAALKHYYIRSGCLTIDRISGDTLPMDQCYINLAIVERAENSRTKQESSQFSISTRLKVNDISKSFQVALPTLFDLWEFNGAVHSPKRIFIQGDAGVGKTTLCKKIVYDYIHNNMWRKFFDCLVWVPLRRLKVKSGLTSTIKLYDLFNEIMFASDNKGRRLSQSLADSIEDSTSSSSRTLFLLDGVDEVHHEVDAQDSLGEFLRHLLRKPNVIITSRPQGLNKKHLGHLDLALETTGFKQEQVEAYINNKEIVKDPAQAKEIQLFLKRNPLMQGLVRIPIQLDAVCYSWSSINFLNNAPQTMTNIYESITWELWRKDIWSLEKKYQGKKLTQNEIFELNARQLASIIHKESEFLGCLAFSGMLNNIVEFQVGHRDQIYEHLDSQGLSLDELPGKILKRLSFLRSSDNALSVRDQTYHFLHLTFQEFFAAQYFVKHWLKRLRLPYLLTSSKSRLFIMPRDFLRLEKYNPSYSVFWRFVTGLILTEGDQELLAYFQLVESEPHNLLGPVLQRFIMHCLCELSPSDEKPRVQTIRARTEEQLYRWLSAEIEHTEDPILIFQSEVPERLLKRLLEGPDKKKVYAMRAFQERPTVSADVLNIIPGLYNSSSIEVKCEAMKTLAAHSMSLSTEGIEALVFSLRDKDERVSDNVAHALHDQAYLSEDVVASIFLLLKDEDGDIRRTAAQALSGQAHLSEDVAAIFALLLDDKDKNTKASAIRALSGQANYIKDIAEGFDLLLKDEDGDVRKSAAETVGRQEYHSKEDINELVLWLNEEFWALAELSMKLSKHKYFYSIILKLDSVQLKGLFKGWLIMSFRQQLTCYIQHQKLLVNLDGIVYKVPFKNSRQKDWFERILQEVKSEWNVP